MVNRIGFIKKLLKIYSNIFKEAVSSSVVRFFGQIIENCSTGNVNFSILSASWRRTRNDISHINLYLKLIQTYHLAHFDFPYHFFLLSFPKEDFDLE